MKKIYAIILAIIIVMGFTACGTSQEGSSSGKIEVSVFVAASLNSVMEELKAEFEAEHEDVTILINADSSGVLMTQIQEGAACDLFFSASQKQMNILEEEGMLLEGTRKNVLNNKLVVLTQADSDTEVIGITTLGKASSIALAGGSVPAGDYTRRALVHLGMLDETDEPGAYTTQEVSDALGGVEISEQSNVSKVLTAVVEGSCEVGTTYLSDTYGQEEKVRIIEEVPYEVTGNIIYPAALIANPDASDEEASAAAEFFGFITGDRAKELYAKHLFDPDVE